MLIADRFVVALLMHRSFQRDSYVSEPVRDSWPGERWVRTVGQECRCSRSRVMQMAVSVAAFTPAEADQLRRAMAPNGPARKWPDSTIDSSLVRPPMGSLANWRSGSSARSKL